MNIPVYNIDSGVPVPDDSHVPIEQLKVGESILFPLEKRPSVQTSASRMKHNDGWEFRVKKMDEENARVWRTK